jgi:LPS sulfotransferase NodH
MPRVVRKLEKKSWDQLGPAYDFPEFSGQPQSYLLATTPRCGGHYLGHLLRETALLGCPLEYFSKGRVRDWQEKLSTKTPEALYRGLFRRRTSPNGWFGVKAHWPQFEPILTNEGLYRIFRFCRFVQLVRRDRVAQAVSLSIADQTGAWISFHEAKKRPSYDFAAISGAIEGISRQLSEWERFFERNGISPLVLYYEDLISRPADCVASVLAHCNIKASEEIEAFPFRPRKQASTLNDEWIVRFLEERSQRDQNAGLRL